jgi:beta-N-acetylhexosaminidase
MNHKLITVGEAIGYKTKGFSHKGANLTSSTELSRRSFLRVIGQGLTAISFLSGCDMFSENGKLESRQANGGHKGASTPQSSTPLPLKALKSSNLDVKIGQMLMVGFRGLNVDNQHFIVRDIQERHLGGVVLSDYDFITRRAVRNIESPSQLKSLIASLKSVSTIPILVCIDHEGGAITRLKERYHFPPTVSHKYLGELNDLETTRKHAALMAKTLSDLGINLNLAPVVDLYINNANPIIAKLERCFSADPQVVTDHALQFIKAHHEEGVLCAPKHFPGHGSSATDSHLGLSDVTDTWSPVEMEPFARIIKDKQADAIMTAHLFNFNLDEKFPATLSQKTISGVLRGDLNYEGVVISDDLQMGAINNNYSLETAIQKTIEAGVDILLFTNNKIYSEEIVANAIEVINKLIRDGIIRESRIDESYQRIQQLKKRLQTG